MSIKNKSIEIKPEEINKITKLAEAIHDYIFGDNEDYDNLEQYLESNSIEVYYAGLDEVDGYLKINKKTGLPRIVIKANQYRPRQRFTMAYELGSLIINYKYLPWQDITTWKNENNIEDDEILDINMVRGSKSPEENRLNKFAAAFLMPTKKILNLAKKFQEEHHRRIKSSELIDVICATFFVSEEAAKLRLKELNLL